MDIKEVKSNILTKQKTSVQTKKQLYDLAQKYKVKGRSKMDKGELAQALEKEINQ